jgi:hypothetical protein
MKRKKLLLATTAIAASLAMGSAAAQQQQQQQQQQPKEANPLAQVASSGQESSFFDGIASNNGFIDFPSNKAAMEVVNALNIKNGNYDIRQSHGRFGIRDIIEIDYSENSMSLSQYLAGNVGKMSNRRLDNLFTALFPAIVFFESQSDGKNFIRQSRNIISDVSCIPHDGGCYLNVAHSANGSTEDQTTLY